MYPRKVNDRSVPYHGTMTVQTGKKTTGKARKVRNRRPDGERSRQKILDAAAEISAERGYDGTSIAEISRRCGLPASSIYWHFEDKDDLMSTVIEDSFDAWNKGWDVPAEDNILAELFAIAEQLIGALRAHPEFLHLGLPLALQKRQDNPRPRRMYLQMRENLTARLHTIGSTHFAHVPEERRDVIITYLIAGAEGLIIAHELDPESDIDALLELHAQSVIQMIMQEDAKWPK
jgi:AcrR family transcriptional regulator